MIFYLLAKWKKVIVIENQMTFSENTKEKVNCLYQEIGEEYICIGDDNDYLISDSCIIEDINYLEKEKITKCNAKFRYRQKDIPVELEWLDNNQILVKYPQGVKRVTPGQACVLYDGVECLGGGIIKEVRKNGKKLWYL